MKKRIITLALGALLVVSSIGFSFAAEPGTNSTTYARGNGIRVSQENLSAQELLKQKIERIDQLVADGKITKEDGENYKNIITERMKDCSTVGENRDKHERLGIGFGRGNGQGRGAKDGSGRRLGRGNGQGMGFCRTATNE